MVLNFIKVITYRAALNYYWHFPIHKGKSFLLRTIYKLLGNAVFKIGDTKFYLCPISFIDEMLIKTGSFDKWIVAVIQKALSSGGVFLDIGANFGYYSVLASKMKDVDVIALEPSPREFKRLALNAKMNTPQNIKPLPVAAADITAKRKLHLAGVSNTGMNSFNPAFESKDYVEVNCIRIDELVNADSYTKLKLIKIDVEGAEIDVLRGMPGLLDNFTGVLICEITPGQDKGVANQVKEIYAMLKAKGYECLHGENVLHQYDEIFFKPGPMAEAIKTLHANWK